MAIRQPRSKITAPRRPSWQSRYHGVRMTEEEFLSLPEEKPYLEYVDGMVLQKPMPNNDHFRLAGRLIARLSVYSDSHGGLTGPENRVRMGDSPNYRLPDVSYFANAQSSTDDAVPTLAIEIRSPDQSLLELRQKCRQFRRAGTAAAWLVDPRTRSVEVFEGKRDGEVLRGDGVLTAEALPGFELPLTALFAVLDR